MSTSFQSIYESAISVIDDPQISQAYIDSPISFFQIMYTYLKNAIPRFNTPLSMIETLSEINLPQGQTEIFSGDGITTTFILSTTPLSDSFFEYQINGATVNGTYNSLNNSITFSSAIPTNQTGSFQWYSVGNFINDIDSTAQNILGLWLVCAWAMKEKNFLLDIRRLLNDTDFKLNDNSTTTKAKISWYEDMREEAEKLQKQYAMNLWLKQYQK